MLETRYLDSSPNSAHHLWHAAVDSTEEIDQHVYRLRCSLGSVNESWRLVTLATLLLPLFYCEDSFEASEKLSQHGLTMCSMMDALLERMRFVHEHRDTPNQRLGMVEVGGKHEKSKPDEGVRTSETLSNLTLIRLSFRSSV